MLKIRRLCEEETHLVSRLKTIVFFGRWDYSKEERKDPDHLKLPAEWTWGAFEGNKLLATLQEIEFSMNFDGNFVPMSGVAGVGTLPEARKGGLMRKMFRQVFLEAYEKGVVFSCLCPFSHSYYRQFGYETACARNHITIPIGEFSHIKPRGDFTQIFPGDDCSALAEIHRGYIANLNHGISRDYWPDNRAWKIFSRSDPYSTGNYLYLWRDEKGRNRGYIKIEDVRNKENQHAVAVRELVFLDRDALYGVLSLIGVLGAQAKEFQWLMPAYLDPADFIGNAWEINQQLRPRDMTCVINVKTAFEKMRLPEAGEFTIEVKDEMIDANNGRFLVEIGQSGGGNRVSKTQKEADLICDIPTLSQLITGYRSLENALYTRKSGLEVRRNLPVLKKAFTLRPQHLTEYF